MHRLDDNRLITPALLRRFIAEAEAAGDEDRYWAAIQREDGNWLTHGGDEPTAFKKTVILDIVAALNRHIAHDGAWVAVWVDPQPKPLAVLNGTDYGKLVLMWMDMDGDVRFPIEIEEDDATLAIKGYAHWCEQAEVAWNIWNDMRVEKVLALAGHEHLYKRALGQSAPSATKH